jgi:hypothetical protein
MFARGVGAGQAQRDFLMGIGSNLARRFSRRLLCQLFSDKSYT